MPSEIRTPAEAFKGHAAALSCPFSRPVLTDCLGKANAAGPVKRPAALMPRSEDLGGAFQRLPDAPGERDADEGPEQRGPGVETALADAERAMLDRGIALEMGRLELGDLTLAHVHL